MRLGESQLAIGFAVGGAPGSRLAHKLSMPISGDTLLRMIRAADFKPAKPPRVVGIDDWAWRKGQRYGTIVCDLERNRIIDLLPNREADTVANWLNRHPGIEIVARDRARFYAEGTTRGAPQARQVADRWHLLRNLGDVLQAIADRHRRDIGMAWRRSQTQHEPVSDHRHTATAPDRRRQENQIAREERYKEMKRLHHRGAQHQEIAKVVGLGHHAVSRWLKAAGPPAHNKPRQPRLLDAFEGHLERHWRNGCRSGTKLWHTIRAEGFTGTERTVRRWAKARAEQEPVSIKTIITAAGSAISSRQCIRLLMQPEESRTEQEHEFIQELGKNNPAFVAAAQLSKKFADLMRNRDPVGFDTWLEQAKGSLLASFASGLQRDGDSVRAAFEEIWSTGPVEGQINKLKLIKRRMYGRAKQDLLRQMVLAE